MKLTMPRTLVPRVTLRTAKDDKQSPATLVEPGPLLPYLGLRAAELTLRTVDRKTAYLLAGPVANLLTLCWPSHWRGLRANLEVISPGLSRRQMRRLLRQNVRNFFKAWIDLLQMSHRPLESWRKLIRLEDGHFLDEARKGGHGVIIVSLHLGSWEAAIAALRDHFTFTEGGLALLAEQVRPIRCFNWLVRARSKVGCQVIPLNVDAVHRGDQEAVSRSGASAVRQIYKVLSRDGVVVIAIDRDLLGTGEPLPFCGRQASIPLGAVEIAARTGAAILPVCLLREPDDTYLGRGYPPIWVTAGENPQESFRRAARQLLRILEPELRAHPDQWHVMTPLFGKPMADLEPLAETRAVAAVGAQLS
ncbi:MAG: lysophospholipid acyltransferase family protein [Candidatus Dormiibacterota bacterium]